MADFVLKKERKLRAVRIDSHFALRSVIAMRDKQDAAGDFRVYPSRWYMLFCCSMFTALQGGYVTNACAVPSYRAWPRPYVHVCKSTF